MKLQNVYVVAENVGAVADFYRALGLETKFQDGDRWAQFNAGGSYFSVASPGEAPADARGAVAVLEVADIDALRGTISEAGGKIFDERDMGDHGRTLTFADPAGNVCQLFQRAGK
jgi:predicted enzyme related to lactoylglutathione lyase